MTRAAARLISGAATDCTQPPSKITRRECCASGQGVTGPGRGGIALRNTFGSKGSTQRATPTPKANRLG